MSEDPMRDQPLREERDFLLASLEDLERELAAGDIDHADYVTLKSDYTTRAADVLRRLDGETRSTASPPSESSSTRRDAIWWVAGVAAVALVAGVLVAME